jgi:hypothetical protein
MQIFALPQSRAATISVNFGAATDRQIFGRLALPPYQPPSAFS